MTDDSATDGDEETVRAASTTDTPIDESPLADDPRNGDAPTGFGGSSSAAGTSSTSTSRSASDTTGSHAPGDRVRVDLQDRVAEIDERMAEIEREAAGLDRDSQAYLEEAEAYEELTHAKEQIEDAIAAWGGSEFAIVKFNAGRDAQVNDRILADMSQSGTEDPATRFNAIKQHTVQVGVVDSPPNTPGNVAEFPTPVREFLYQKLNNLNSYGSTDLQDFSLSRALDDRDSAPN